MAQKQEEDRAKERARQEKKAEKDKRKAEAAKQQAAIHQAANNKPTVNHVKTEGAKNEKKGDRQQKKMKPKVAGNGQHVFRKARNLKPTIILFKTGPSFFAKFFMLLLRLIILAGVTMAVVYALNWEGPLTLDNAGKVAHRSLDKAKGYGLEVYDWASPHLQTIKGQWKHLSRFVAENGRDVVNVAWDRTVHYAKIAHQQFWETWPIVHQRIFEVLNLTGDTAIRYWRIVCRDVPIYYGELLDKVSHLFHGTQSQAGNQS